MTTTHEQIVQYLGEARTIEDEMLRTLQAHLAVAPKGDYRRALERHLRQTEQHRHRVERRLSELGEARSVLEAGVDALQNVAGQVIGLYRGPLEAMLGQRGEERALRNAREHCAAEAVEIGTYCVLEALAREAGDTTTARLAERNREDEVRMLEELQRLLPQLVLAVAGLETG